MGLALIGAMASGSPTAADPPGEIVIIGDSLTAGYGLPGTQAYPAVLQEKIDAARLPWRVINAGVNGDTTADGVRRGDGAVNETTRILILALGANDGLQRGPVSSLEKNLVAIIDQARRSSPGVVVVIAGMRMPEELAGADYAAAYNQAFARVAKRSKAILLPYLLDQVGGVAALNQADSIHPTAQGQRRIAETVWAVLAPLLRKP